MSEPFKKQHIVPQSYLNRFGWKNNKDKYIIGTRLNPQDNGIPKLFEESVDSVGYINNYYDVDVLDDKKFWEHFFSRQIDSLCGQPLGNIIAKITLSEKDEHIISYQDKITLAKIILSQSIKVPEFINTGISELKTFLENGKLEMINENPHWSEEIKEVVNNIDFDENMRKGLIFEIMFNEKRFNRFIKILVNKTWLIFYNQKAATIPFVTSDNPVISINPFTKKKGVYTNGIGTDSTIIFYPLSSHIAVGIYPSIWFWGVCEKFDCKRCWVDDLKFLMNLNVDVVEQSFKHSFLPNPLYSNIKTYKEENK